MAGTPKINFYEYITKSPLVNIIRSHYNIVMIENIVKQAGKFLLKNNLTVAVAESCTGGLTSSLLTKIPGSSKYFILGIVAYHNRSKIRILKVPASLLIKKGAVSQEVAVRMAKSVRNLAKTDFGIGITGIAGPGGEVPTKPVGTVFIALASKNKATCKKFFFLGNRSMVRKKAALKSLELLTQILQ